VQLRRLVVSLVLLAAIPLSGCGSEDEDDAVTHVKDSLSGIRQAEETYFDRHAHYTDRLPDLQLIGPTSVSGMLGIPSLDYVIETSSNDRVVTVSVRADDADAQGWFTLENGREYGTGGYGST
jgi:hypothetical protein